MAEWDIEAPLAKFEGEEVLDFIDSEDVENSNKDFKKPTESNENSFVDNFGETISGSLEDLVNTFDEKITSCFCNYDEKVEKFAPVQVQEEILNECRKHPIWWKLIDISSSREISNGMGLQCSSTMKDFKMAMLKMKAPLAKFESEEWSDFNDL